MDEEKGRRRHYNKDAAEVAEIFDTLSTKLPEMIRGLLDSLFSPESAANMGKAIAEFRKSLIEGGIPEEEAMEMTREYLGTLTSWSKMMREVRGSKKFKREEE